MANDHVMSTQTVRYLLVMHRLSASGGRARCVNMAEALLVSRPSVHSMMQRMGELGLVRSEQGRTYALTESGREAAELYDAACKKVAGALESYLTDGRTRFNATSAFVSELQWETLQRLAGKR
jgi:Mn-dependent DtxR family transcriptional regulator